MSGSSIPNEKIKAFLVEHDVKVLIDLAKNDTEAFTNWAKDLLHPIYDSLDDGRVLLEMLDSLGYSLEDII